MWSLLEWKILTINKIGNALNALDPELDSFSRTEELDTVAKDVVIGDNTKILANTVIFGVTEIGRNCVISSNCTIGSEGFGFSYNETEFIHFNHMGKISIGDNVWIGSGVTVLQGVKIGKNSIIGAKSLVNKNVP